MLIGRQSVGSDVDPRSGGSSEAFDCVNTKKLGTKMPIHNPYIPRYSS